MLATCRTSVRRAFRGEAVGRRGGTLVRLHLLAVDCAEFSLIQISDLPIGRNVFQIGEQFAILPVTGS